jgi:hypothetical protein
VQPDIRPAGGIVERKKFAEIGEPQYVKVTPHNPLGPLATMVRDGYLAISGVQTYASAAIGIGASRSTRRRFRLHLRPG